MTREEAIKIINCYDIGFHDLSGEKIPSDKLADAFDMAIEALTERNGEVVRCKDCKRRKTDDCPMYWMEWITIDEGDGYTDNNYIIHDYTTDNGYCSWGERKGGDSE